MDTDPLGTFLSSIISTSRRLILAPQLPARICTHWCLIHSCWNNTDTSTDWFYKLHKPKITHIQRLLASTQAAASLHANSRGADRDMRFPGKSHAIIRERRRKPLVATSVIKVFYMHHGSNTQLQLHLERVPDLHNRRSAGTSVQKPLLTQILWLHPGCV